MSFVMSLVTPSVLHPVMSLMMALVISSAMTLVTPSVMPSVTYSMTSLVTSSGPFACQHLLELLHNHSPWRKKLSIHPHLI